MEVVYPLKFDTLMLISQYDIEKFSGILIETEILISKRLEELSIINESIIYQLKNRMAEKYFAYSTMTIYDFLIYFPDYYETIQTLRNLNLNLKQ